MGALSLMTILSVVIGRIFHSVPAQFQTSKFVVIGISTSGWLSSVSRSGSVHPIKTLLLMLCNILS